jgi:hypothetical protein
MVSSLVPNTYCSVTHFMMQFLSSHWCICCTHNSNYLICIYRPRKISQSSDCYRSENKCGSDVGFSLCQHICHSAISSIGTWYSDNSVVVTTGNHVELRLRIYRLCICTSHISSSPYKSHAQKPLTIGHQEHLQAALCQSRPEALTVVLLRIQPFCNVTSCHWVTDPWWFERQWLTAYPWWWRHHVPLEWCKQLTQWHSVTSQETWTIKSMWDFKMRLEEYSVKSVKTALPIIEVSLLRKHVFALISYHVQMRRNMWSSLVIGSMRNDGINCT